MNTILLKEENYNISNWSGGKTKELTIFPRDKKYIDRDFTFRISSATVELDESDFSKLPDYDRIIMPLSGEVILNYNGEKTVKLKELEMDSFDGAWKTKSYGKITDFNLMTRKGSEGHMDLIYPEQEKQNLTSTHEDKYDFKRMKETQVLFVKNGYAIVSIGGTSDSQMVKAGETYVIEGDFDEKIAYSVMGEGVTIRSSICYEAAEGETGPTVIPREPATFDDFKCAMFLANTQFRGANHLFKSIDRTWYDEELQYYIGKLERTFITFIVTLIGILLCIFIGFGNGASDAAIFLSLIAWIIADCIVVSPLIFFLVLPKPIRKHIKDIDKLTPYEKKVREENLGRNERTEKILKKYKEPKGSSTWIEKKWH